LIEVKRLCDIFDRDLSRAHARLVDDAAYATPVIAVLSTKSARS
jgi:hypothetical protein